MLFNSAVFLFVFLPIAYVVFWALRSSQARYVWLTITGYVFYGYWDPRFCLLMAFSTLASYFAGLGFLRWTDPRHRRLCLILPITVDLLLLGYFKYADFTLDAVQGAGSLFGLQVKVPHLDILLPIGISFYTFHTISYIVDSYRGVIKPTRNLFEFASYVSLFSQLVAGPIVRFRQIEEDLEGLGTASRSRWRYRGVSIFIVGLVEKVIIADSLAAVVDPALAAYSRLSTAGAWLAMSAYSFQLYFDFSGYSSMAVGLGYLFGLRIPQNFDSPYKALDPSDFWRRWHISLSQCMRDYLYISFGGNRGSELRTYRNLFLTMLIGGLWHGAAWTFIVWGAFHGVLLSLHRRFGRVWDSLGRGVRQVTMFLLVTIGWVFFRSHGFSMAGRLLRTMFTPTPGVSAGRLVLVLPLVALAAGWAMLGPNIYDLSHARRPRWDLALAVSLGAALALILGDRVSPFLYFQF